MNSMMFFGAQYYRPPFPAKCDWEADIRHMKSLNFNVIKLWAVWNWIERRQGEFDFSDLDEIVDLCEKYGLKVIINTIPEGAPPFTRVFYPDARYCKADGTVLDYSGPANIPSAGWPGLCQDSPSAREQICRFIYETARHFENRTQVIAIDVWNEPHLEPMFDYSGELLCYCEYSVAAFRRWLRERYRSIEELNKVWFRCYEGWEDVQAPIRFGTGADMIDWRRFWLYNLKKWMHERAEAARKGAPDKLIQSHVAFSGYMGANNDGGLGNELGDEFLLAQETDVFGLSSFPLWLMGKEHEMIHLINAEIVAEASRGKCFYQVEQQGGAGKAGLLGGVVPKAGDIKVWNWNILAAGGKGTVYWQYAPEPAGMESPGFGLVNGCKKDTERALAAGTFAKTYHQQKIAVSKRVLPVNGILLSRDADLLTYAAREEQQYAESFKGVYKALYERSIPVRFIHEDFLEDAQEEGLQTLYLPMTLALSEKTKSALLQFTERGGTLIAEGPVGMYCENGETDMQFDFLRTFTGAQYVSIDLEEKSEQLLVRLSDKESGCGSSTYQIEMQGYRVIAEGGGIEDACLGRYADNTASVVSVSYGAGRFIWIAGFIGQYFWKKTDKGTGDFLAALFDPNGYRQIDGLKADGLVIRLLETPDSYLLLAVNHGNEERKLSVQVGYAVIERMVPSRDGILEEVEK